MWVYDIFVSVCARNTAAKWYLPHQEKQHLTQTGRGWAGRPAKRDLTKSLLRKLHERRMHSDQIDHRSIFAKSHTSQEGWKEGESECQRKLRGAEPAKVPVRCQPVEEATTSRRRRTLGIESRAEFPRKSWIARAVAGRSPGRSPGCPSPSSTSSLSSWR